MNVLTATGYVWAIFSWPMIYTCVIVLQHWLPEAIANMASLFTSCRWWPSQGIASELHESPENLTRWRRWPFGDSHYDIIWTHGSSKLGRTSWNNQVICCLALVCPRRSMTNMLNMHCWKWLTWVSCRHSGCKMQLQPWFHIAPFQLQDLSLSSSFPNAGYNT